MTQFSIQKADGGFILNVHPIYNGVATLEIPTPEVFTSEAKLIKRIRELLGSTEKAEDTQ